MEPKFDIRNWSLVVLLGLLPACATNSSAPGLTPLPATVKDVEPARKSLRAADAAFAKLAEKSGAAQAFYEFLAPNATVLLPEAQPLEGREGVSVHLTAAAE